MHFIANLVSVFITVLVTEILKQNLCFDLDFKFYVLGACDASKLQP